MMTTHSDRTETLAAVFADSRREDDVRAALRDPRIKHPELIAVSVDEVGTVVLHGAVGPLSERLAAAGVVRVTNQIEIR